MANNCYFDMKIVGTEKNIQEFIQMMKWQGPYKNNGLIQNAAGRAENGRTNNEEKTKERE